MKWVQGQVLPLLEKPEITLSQLKQYGKVSGDLNPIHFDKAFAEDAGFPSVIAHGMLSMAFLGDYLIKYFSEDEYRLVRFKTRFRKVTFPGDVLTCFGHVKEVSRSQVIISLGARNQNGIVTTEGEAILSVGVDCIK